MKDITFSNIRACEPKPVPYYIGCIKSRKLDIVPNSFSFNLPNDFNTSSAVDTWLHAIDDSIAGITYLYPPATSNPTTPISCTDVSTIQSWFNSLGIGITYTVNSLNEIVLFYNNISEVNRWFFWLGSGIADGHTNKITPTLQDIQVDEYDYQEVQVVKEYLDEVYRDRYFVVTSNPLQEVFFDSNTQVFNFGNCPVCDNEIISVEVKYDNIKGIPDGYVPYYWGDTLTNTFTSTGINDTYIHAIYGILNGSSIVSLSPETNTAYTTAENGIIATDTSKIQATLDLVTASIGFPNQAIYVLTTTNQFVIYLSSSLASAISNNTYIHIYGGNISTPGTYTNKIDITTLSNITTNDIIYNNYQCISIQEIKYKNRCTNALTYKYVKESDIDNKLLTYIPIGNISDTCYLGEIEIKETCGYVNGSTVCQEIYKLYRRDLLTGEILLLNYEDKLNNVLSDVEEICCNCDCVCMMTNNTPQPNRMCIGYGGNIDLAISKSGFMGVHRYDTNWATSACSPASTSFTWELVACIVNGTELLATPVVVTVPYSSMTLTSSGIATNYATAFNALPQLINNDIVLEPDFAVYSYNTSKPFLLAFKNYSDNLTCSLSLGRIEFIKGGVSDGWDYAASGSFGDLQTKAMAIYNDANIANPQIPVATCITI